MQSSEHPTKKENVSNKFSAVKNAPPSGKNFRAGSQAAKAESDDFSQPINSMVSRSLRTLITPLKHGHWDGEREKSEFIFDDDYIFRDTAMYPDRLTMREIKNLYCFESISYHNNEPDFSSFSRGTVQLSPFPSRRTGNDGTYTQAMAALARETNQTVKDIEHMMEEEHLTWHECSDRKTMMLIPSIINATYKHTGGIGIQRAISAHRKYMKKRFEGKSTVLSFDSPANGGIIEKKELEQAIRALKRAVRKEY